MEARQFDFCNIFNGEIKAAHGSLYDDNGRGTDGLRWVGRLSEKCFSTHDLSIVTFSLMM